MQRVTASLGFTKMAVYRYVSGRAELIALMTEVAGDLPPDLEADLEADLTGMGWREALKRWAAALFEVFTRHPWLLEATVGPRVMGPRELAWMEHALRALDQSALQGWERLDIVATVAGHVRTIAQQSQGSAHPETEMMGAITPLIEARADEFPALIAAIRSGHRDQAFDVGLECILAGIEVMGEKRSARRPGRKPPGGA